MISSMASISSSSSATVRVEKATSEFLIGPDWTLNIDICDTINSNQMLAKDVVKAVKKRLLHKNPKVQLLALTRFGVQFPQHSPDAAAIFTPPVTHAILRHPQPSYGMPSSSSTRLDEAMAAEEKISLSSINSMRDVLDLLNDMLKAIDPNDRMAVNDEVIIDLVEQCRANQRKLMQLLGTTGDEEILCQGLELNDNLQSVLAKHDAIASGSPLPREVINVTPGASEKHDSTLRTAEDSVPKATSNDTPPAPVLPAHRGEIDEEDEEEDDFAQLEASAATPRPSQAERPSYPQFQAQPQHHTQPWPQRQHQHQTQPWLQPQPQPQPRPQAQLHPQLASAYPPPPWAATPGYFSNQNPESRLPYTYSTPTPASSSNPRPVQHESISGEVQINSSTRSAASNAGQRPFIPSYRLFEDLNVFGNTEGRFKSTGNASPSLLGSNNQNAVGGRK
ncbi:UNVERIFIED_CONTAM: TOM1-like protein 6 [Sesamum latifolium]|uniref:TOM1-like protein 6 n=1 Tax=Sesamum latifolium TaxID=2727402 RepID=A0AAW2XGH2_9LAMI